MRLRQGINATSGTVLATVTADGNGEFVVNNLAAGNYTGEFSTSGYQTAYRTLTCIGNRTNLAQDVTMTPNLSQGEVRIVLTWGATPSDLDSHCTGPIPGSTDRFHMYYPNKGTSSPWPDLVSLDLDDTSSYGPETTTLYQVLDSGVYRFSVYDYTNGGSTNSNALSNSGASVKVYGDSGLLAEYNVPVGQGGTLWTVFEIINGQIVPVNNMSYGSSSGNISSLHIIQTDAHLIHNLPPKE